MTRLLLPFAALAVLTLAACGDAPDNNTTPATTAPAATPAPNDGTTTMQIEVPDSMVPAVEAITNPGQAMEDLRARASAMSAQAKQDAVVNARRAAEAGARALGQTEAEITQAGDVAERSARDALGL